MSAGAERRREVLTVIHRCDVLPAPIYVDVARAVGVEDASERHPVVRVLGREA